MKVKFYLIVCNTTASKRRPKFAATQSFHAGILVHRPSSPQLQVLHDDVRSFHASPGTEHTEPMSGFGGGPSHSTQASLAGPGHIPAAA